MVSVDPGGLAPLLLLYFHFLGSSASTNPIKRKLKVTTVLLEPYVMIKANSNKTRGPTTYEGYIVDLLDRLASVMNFKYELKPSPDGEYGNRQHGGKWDGMVGQLLRREVDIAAASMHVTKYRSKVVDFTTPYMDVYATMLLRKPPNGGESHIKTITDIINQSEIKYGTLDTGILLRAYQNTNDTTLRIMIRNMQRFKPSVFTQTNEDGINRVRREKYAFVIPNTIGEYVANLNPCDLVAVGRFLQVNGYGFAVQKRSDLLIRLNSAISELKDSGYLDRLYNKWWVQKNECSGIQSSRVYSVNSGSQVTRALLPLLCTLLLLHR